ncbi:MAG TPA: hypothetical protein PKC55_10765 [Dysgonomonas sp.]|uniref:hypothetical protein n=1 Tax=unclassified Dysgonomonas TaxID=2630389 RepID=UPI0025C40D2C|nr:MULTISPECIES: hypothetical protein [unclassified Dysgonomonas]HML65301.1 hypothetical protein [Dysgonomonas sp.]
MLYIIDDENFNGCIVAKMNDDRYLNYTALKLDTYKAKMGLPGLIAVTTEEFEKRREEYIASCQTGFTQISEDEFYIRINESEVIKRHFLSKELKFFYLTGEESAFGIMPLYVCYKNNYYMAQKDIKLSLDSILSYIKDNRNLVILNLEDAGHDIGLFNYMQDHGISDITDFFDTEPDKIRLDDTDIFFVQVDDKRDRYIIYTNKENALDKNMLQLLLERFYCDNYLSFFEKKYSVWDEYKEKCIAYRDGKGYGYTIWQYRY